ncbi:hypothetical protein DDT54_14320 [Brenneria nigrifluens DSM 30175 = ATCC 13028]|uniref:Uncharacterized protein n=1 Tax=Brenneria nigrifluens DSM 30175 = ATCC 13028 TaxID=1121120 RepID=A0A2U1UPA3_9GAMM|nr:hypothetical protein DDT54_14320 [Brenneria nigrifluens DSM 30175 = ATCC 13028]
MLDSHVAELTPKNNLNKFILLYISRHITVQKKFWTWLFNK